MKKILFITLALCLVAGSAGATDMDKRFGLGFNSVYNVTECPTILTGNKIGIFDPHGRTVAGASTDRSIMVGLILQEEGRSCVAGLYPCCWR